MPPYHVDTAETRADYARYYDEISRLDKYVGRVLAELEAQGSHRQYPGAVLFRQWTPVSRATKPRSTTAECALHGLFAGRTASRPAAPVAAWYRWSTSHRLSLESGGSQACRQLDFRRQKICLPLLEAPDSGPIRDYIFAEKNWHDFEDHARAARDERFKYIRNDYPDLPLTPSADSARSPTYEALKAAREAGTLTQERKASFRSRTSPGGGTLRYRRRPIRTEQPR